MLAFRLPSRVYLFSSLSVLAALLVYAGPLQATTVSLSVSPSSSTSGAWADGELVVIDIQVETDGVTDQGFSLGDFKNGGGGLTVDTACVKVHEVLSGGTTQVDDEDTATALDPLPSYSKADDTWVYEPFTSFTGTVDMSDDAFRAVADAPASEGFEIGQGSPVDFLHVVLEIQGPISSWTTTDVTFAGQLVPYNTASDDWFSNIFGTAGPGDFNTGSFTLTRVPEPATAALMAAGVALAAFPRRRP